MWSWQVCLQHRVLRGDVVFSTPEWRLPLFSMKRSWFVAFPNHQSIAHSKAVLGRDEASYRCSVVTHTLLLSAVGIRDFAWAETESESELVHIVVLVFLLPRAVAGLAYANSTFRRDKVTRAPHLCCVIKGERSATKFLIRKSITRLDCARNFTGICFLRLITIL